MHRGFCLDFAFATGNDMGPCVCPAANVFRLADEPAFWDLCLDFVDQLRWSFASALISAAGWLAVQIRYPIVTDVLDVPTVAASSKR